MCSSADSISQQPSLHGEINTAGTTVRCQLYWDVLCTQTEIYIPNTAAAAAASALCAEQEQGGSRHRECRGQRSDDVGENVLRRLPSSAVCEKSDD